MLKQLAREMNIPEKKMPNNVVENFGNAASVSIPTAITHNLGAKLLKESHLFCLAGFGNGLSWSSLLIPVGNLDFCQLINYN